jgi:2-dehydropantoate 2-reductase
MKICVVGAGAIGGLIGAKMALAGEDVTLIARGEHLAVIREKGLKLVMGDGTEHVAKNIRATDSYEEAGKQDIVFLALKAHQIAGIATKIRTLFGPDTMVVTLQNGVPFWYFSRHGGPHEGHQLETVDPTGEVAANIEPERIIGSVVFPAAVKSAPGVITHIEGNRFPVGELDGQETDRVKLVAETFTKAGFKSFVLDNIRAEIWLKLWGNLSFNPISAVTHSTLVDICQYPLTRDLAAQMMTEAAEVAGKLGISVRVPLEKRIDGAEKVGKHKTSMLQDVEAGRPLELDPVMGAVVELGRLTDTPTPHIDTLYSCVKLLDKMMAEEKVYVRAARLEAGAQAPNVAKATAPSA